MNPAPGLKEQVNNNLKPLQPMKISINKKELSAMNYLSDYLHNAATGGIRYLQTHLIMQELKQTPAGLFVVKYASERPNPKDFDSAGIFDAADRYFEELKAWQSSAVSYPVYWGEVKKFMDFAAVESMTLPGGSALVVALTAGIRIPDENVSIKRVTPAGAAERVHMAFFVLTPTPEVKGEDKNARMWEYIDFLNFFERFEYVENTHGQKGYREITNKPFKSDFLIESKVDIFKLWLKHLEQENPVSQ